MAEVESHGLAADLMREALEAALTPRTCALLIEPIQCEAGILAPPLIISEEDLAWAGRTGAQGVRGIAAGAHRYYRVGSDQA
jgi:acetylornithine/succinyldiaminopimelate/putrescine aminotransferase